MSEPADDIVFLFDCDDTLLDNDGLQNDLTAYLRRLLGDGASERYWRCFEEIRADKGYADYLGALQELRLASPHDPRVMQISGFLLDYPFATRLYPGALDALDHCRRFGRTVILSDGDAVYQPHKLARSGISGAVEGRVLIYVHKERELDELQRQYPARRYVMVDDKLRLLTAMKSALSDRMFTVFPRQGHYALDAAANRDLPAADLTIQHIGELTHYDFRELMGDTKWRKG